MDYIKIFEGISLADLIIIIGGLYFLFDKIKFTIKKINEIHDDEKEDENLKIRFKDIESKFDLLIKGQLALLRYYLIDEFKEVIKNESITVDELDDIKHLYEIYTKLGGNGTITKLYKDVIKLKIRKEDNNED